MFPDNTVLCNFAAVSRLDVLEAVLHGRGRWTEAVADEAQRSSRVLPELALIPLRGWLDDPVELSGRREVATVERIRRAVFGGSSAQPLAHLGEAQTCYLIKHRAEFRGSWWISDDREAVRYARRQQIITYETIDLAATAVSKGVLTSDEAFALLHDTAAKGRHPRLPSSPHELLRPNP
ncbi:hypothetical protein [Kineosporia mesophila]|uniref:hypothetical protein n=1 Tax=Kineosporia mesophila TaxID=566012 RepID=UPI001E4C1982|nr:hypothetical protein [Kineosporia mesophila]MCD5348940.1 hypothetical protein [Kineosporia mesophila]